MIEPFSARQTLLRYNAGIWTGSFIRFSGQGFEEERFGSHLHVSDQAGVIVAELTNLASGQMRAMRFAEPPVEMQISSEGHWSLGPDRIGPWPWVSELCLVWGEHRRRAVIRHGCEQLESLVLVSEARPGQHEQLEHGPLQVMASAHPNGAHLLWTMPNNKLGVSVQTMAARALGRPEHVALHWQPTPGVALTISRHYGANGLLLDQFADQNAPG